MSTVNTSKSLLDPQTFDMLQSLKQDIFRSLNAVKIGQIRVFDPSKKTAQVQILFKRVVPSQTGNDGQTIQDYPVLVDCPVFTLQGDGGAIQMPIVPGDQCVLLFSDRNIDGWFQNGSAVAPFDARCHDLSDGICLVGLNSLASDLSDYPADTLRISYDDAAIDISGGILKLYNNTTTLLTLMNGFIDVIAAATLDLDHSTLSAATITALEDYKLQFAELLL